MGDPRCVECGKKDARTLSGAIRCALCKSAKETAHVMTCRKVGCTRCGD